MGGRGLCAQQKRRFRPKTTDSRHFYPIASNRLADLTYSATAEGWLCLHVRPTPCGLQHEKSTPAKVALSRSRRTYGRTVAVPLK